MDTSKNTQWRIEGRDFFISLQELAVVTNLCFPVPDRTAAEPSPGFLPILQRSLLHLSSANVSQCRALCQHTLPALRQPRARGGKKLCTLKQQCPSGGPAACGK